MSNDADQRQDTVTIEIDGQAVEAPKGSMIIEAADRIGVEIPRFCYHKKLSIAASCRMCLVDVEKAPKPMPACATPVMDGMKVYTDSRRAIDAQHNVMEFLLINHPLDCPICDQGGECELQDLAMGYGRSVSRFTERKRVVKDSNVGPLVQTEMTRCIHCTRCIRFLDEVAGTHEMGGSGRGDRLEIGTCVENSIDSELSGNIIDLCPVGALTNKPFRFAARAWELVARPSLSVHDGVGSCVYHHQRRGKILRTVPRENESTNETWLSDRDRYSHQGLYSEDRATEVLVKAGGEWRTVNWDEGVDAAAAILREAGAKDDKAALGVLMSGNAATEEYFLAQRLARALGSNNIDHRLRQGDFSDDATASNSLFQMKIAEMETADAVLLVGCNPRHEAPLIGHRLRKAWRSGCAVSVINSLDQDFVFEPGYKTIVAPQFLVQALSAVACAIAQKSDVPVAPELAALLKSAAPTEADLNLAQQLIEAQRGLVLLGHITNSHPDGAVLRQLGAYIAAATGSAFNQLTHGGNAVGALLAGAVPHGGPGGEAPAAEQDAGLNAGEMLAAPCSNWLLWNLEPDFDVDNPYRATAAFDAADKLVVVSEFVTDSLRELADVILPLASIAESEGTIHNLDGLAQSFAPAGRTPGEAKPGWKILRKLGAALELPGFEHTCLSQVQADMTAALETAGSGPGKARGGGNTPATMTATKPNGALWRIGELPIYSTDALCRRTSALQATKLAEHGFAGFNAADAAGLGLKEGSIVSVSQGEAKASFDVRISAAVPAGAVLVHSATESAKQLGLRLPR